MLSVCLFGQDVITEVMMAALERNDPNVTITDKISPRSAHISIAGGQYMLVWGGYTEVAVGERYLNPAEVNIYHLEHKYWTKHVCDGDIPPGTSGAVASYEPGSEHMLLFGGHTAQGNSNLLFRLDLKTFRWTNLSPDDPDQLARWPSPRDKFCAWSYKHKLFCFGGFGLPIERYLNENGSFVIDSTTHSPDVRGWNNQLLVYDEKTQKWSNPKCKGTVPLARAAMATFKLGEKVYLFGGRHMDKRMNDLHCFNLEDYSWSGELRVKKQNVYDFTTSLKYKFQCVLNQKKRTSTALAFEEDMQWVQDEIKKEDSVELGDGVEVDDHVNEVDSSDFDDMLTEYYDDDRDPDYKPESKHKRYKLSSKKLESEKPEGENEIVSDSDEEEEQAEIEHGSPPCVVKFIREEMTDKNSDESESKPDETESKHKRYKLSSKKQESEKPEGENEIVSDSDEEEGQAEIEHGSPPCVVKFIPEEMTDKNSDESESKPDETESKHKRYKLSSKKQESEKPEGENEIVSDSDEEEGQAEIEHGSPPCVVKFIREEMTDKNSDESESKPDETESKHKRYKLSSKKQESEKPEGENEIVSDSDEEEGQAEIEHGSPPCVVKFIREEMTDKNSDESESKPDETESKHKRYKLSSKKQESEKPEGENEIVSDSDEEEGQAEIEHGSPPCVVQFIPEEMTDKNSDESEYYDDDRDPDYKPESKHKRYKLSSKKQESEKPEGENEIVSDSDEEEGLAEIEHGSLPCFVKFIRKELTDNSNDESESKPYERDLSEYEKVRDKKYRNIYIKKYDKSVEGKRGKEKKDSRPYDTVHACIFCNKLCTHIQDHMEKIHSDMEMVVEILKLKKMMKTSEDKSLFKRQIKKLQDCLRFEGDHFHNLRVKQAKEGELLIQRKSCHQENFDVTEYGPCPECFQWIKLGCSVKIHQQNCPKSVKNHNFSKGKLVWQARHLIGEVHASDSLRKEVFTKMNNDDIGTCAQADELICKLGEVWLSKCYSHTLRRGKDSSFHMRLAARLLEECRKRLGQPALDMLGLITIQNFDCIVEATLGLCGRNEHGELKHPSTANKIGFDLARLAALKYGLCLKNRDQVGKEETDGFLKYMKIHWSTKVSTQSNHLLATRHFDNRRKLPHPNDIELVATKLTEKLNDFDYKDSTKYGEVARVALLRLMVYNRRRSGEIEELKMEKYLNRRREVDDVEQSLLGELTTTEKYLMKSQELIWIRGKRGKRVPVLIPHDTAKALTYITDTEVRRIGGVKPTNQYMFATKGDGTIRASECIKELGNNNASELIHPDRLTSTGYRAYMATIAQCLGLKDHQIQWLCTHLGHTIDVHQSHYRFALDGIERIQLGKLLLLQDRNLLSKYKDTELNDIEFEDIISSSEKAVDGSDKETSPSEVQAGPSRLYEYEDQGELELDEIEMGDSITVQQVPALSGQKKKSSAARVRWTDKEIEEIKLYASAYIAKKKTPCRKVCQTYITQSREAEGQLHRRSAAHIVKKISAINVKARKTELVTEGATPCGRSWHSLTAVSHDTAFLYGGYSTEGTPLSDAWQLNVGRRQWTQMTVPAGIRKCRLWHTGCCSPEGEVLIFGGCCSDLLDYTNVDFQQHSNKVLSFHTKPLSLRSLCLQAAYKNKSQLQDYWFTLPRDLADWLHRQSQVEKIKSNTPASGLQKQGSTCVVS